MQGKKINLKKIKPHFTRIVTTADRYTKEEAISEGGLTIPDMEGAIKDIQTIVALGDTAEARGHKVGDLISISFRNYEQRKQKKGSTMEIMDEVYNPIVSYSFTFVNLDGKDYLYLDMQDIEFTVLEYTEDTIEVKEAPLEKGSKLISPNSKLVCPC